MQNLKDGTWLGTKEDDSDHNRRQKELIVRLRSLIEDYRDNEGWGTLVVTIPLERGRIQRVEFENKTTYK